MALGDLVTTVLLAGTDKHMKLILAFPHNRPICEDCNKNLGAPSGLVKEDGSRLYNRLCQGCRSFKNHGNRNFNKKQYHKPGKEYLRHRKNFCEECSFVPVHPCQLDVDHTDGDHENNCLSNLRTLCANCHRLKTQQNKDNFCKKWRVLK